MITKIHPGVLEYLLDEGLIIMAEYDRPEEYSDDHWIGILSDAILKIKERSTK